MSHRDERTPAQLAAMGDADLVAWLAGVIHGAAVMGPFKCRYPEGVDPMKSDHVKDCLTHADDRLCSLGYAEAARRHPKAPLYQRAYNQIAREQGHGSATRPEDWST